MHSRPAGCGKAVDGSARKGRVVCDRHLRGWNQSKDLNSEQEPPVDRGRRRHDPDKGKGIASQTQDSEKPHVHKKLVVIWRYYAMQRGRWQEMSREVKGGDQTIKILVQTWFWRHWVFISQAITQSDLHFSPSLEGMEMLLLALRRKDWGSRRPRWARTGALEGQHEFYF